MTVNTHPITIAAAVSQRQEDFRHQANAERRLDDAVRRDARDADRASLPVAMFVTRALRWRPTSYAQAPGRRNQPGFLPAVAPRVTR